MAMSGYSNNMITKSLVKIDESYCKFHSLRSKAREMLGTPSSVIVRKRMRTYMMDYNEKYIWQFIAKEGIATEGTSISDIVPGY